MQIRRPSVFYGDYDNDEDFDTIKISHGHNKDPPMGSQTVRPRDGHEPAWNSLFTQPYSGNESDRKILLETIEKVKQNLNLEDKAYYVADSAFYTEHNLQSLGRHTFWISRPPHLPLRK
jgi:hypothetical protein